MSAKAYSLPPANITSTINDLASLIEFFRDKEAMDAIYQSAIEQAKLLDEEQTKADEARKYLTSNQDLLTKIETASDQLTKKNIMHKKNLDDFDSYKKQEELRLNNIQQSLDLSKKDLEDREQTLLASSKKFQDETAAFEISKKQNELNISKKQDALMALGNSIDEKKLALDTQEKGIQEKFDRLKSIIG